MKNADDPARDLYSPLGMAIADYSMIEKPEIVLLGVSGGKDSLLMAYLLAEMRRRSPVKFTLEAVTVDSGGEFGFTDEELARIGGFLEGLGIPHHVVRTDIGHILQSNPGENPCSLCANLRRGALCKTGDEMGIRTIALAHHLDDAIETLFLNMFYHSSLRCFEPKTYLSRRNVTTIRPLIYIPEDEIVKAGKALELPVVKARCPIAGTTTRQDMKEVVRDLSEKIPSFRNHMRSVLRQLWKGGEQ